MHATALLVGCHFVQLKFLSDCISLQKVLASRKELIEYDNRVRESPLIKSSAGKPGSEQITTTSARSTVRSISVHSDAHSVPGRCYGCSSAATEHCVNLLKALAMKQSTRDTLIKEVIYLLWRV